MSWLPFMAVLIPLLNERAERVQRKRQWQEYEERLFDCDVQSPSRQENETRMQQGNISWSIYWSAMVPDTVTKASFESPHHAPPVFIALSPLPSQSSVQPESQTQSGPVKQSSNDDAGSTLVGIKYRPASAFGILHSYIWRWPLLSGTPALPGKRFPGKQRSTREIFERDRKQ
ncbi:hypothetical protein MMC22_001803 [Lobaria immixta]|nr:hypothetical protein [Lobaria immixta]